MKKLLRNKKVLLVDKKILDDAGLNPGQIKENITVSGLDLSDAKIGQVFSLVKYVLKIDPNSKQFLPERFIGKR